MLDLLSEGRIFEWGIRVREFMDDVQYFQIKNYYTCLRIMWDKYMKFYCRINKQNEGKRNIGNF